MLTEIDVKDTLKKKIDVDFKKYKILGACNPQFAYKALQTEDKIGVFLPCNVVIEEHADGAIEVSAVDSIASMGEASSIQPATRIWETMQELIFCKLEMKYCCHISFPAWALLKHWLIKK